MTTYTWNAGIAMISQPMAGKTDAEIAAVREQAVGLLQDRGYRIANTLFNGESFAEEVLEECGVECVPLYYLAKSLESMSKCHAVYFCRGWKDYRGCRIEHEAAAAYGLEIIYEDT